VLRAVRWLGVVLFLFCIAPPAFASEKDDAQALAALDKVLANEVANANFGEAKKKVKAVIDRCRKVCSQSVIARAEVVSGVIAAQIGQADEAKTAWFDAFNIDSSASLPASGISPTIRAQFEAAQKEWIAKNPQPDDAQKAGWVSKQAFDLAKAAVAAEQAGNYPDCIEKNKAALTIEENMRARLHLAQCEQKSGKVVDALRDNAKALESARTKGDAASVKQIQERVAELVPKLAHVKFELPTGINELKITFDDRPIPPNRYNESFTIDPGSHNVKAEGTLRGGRVSSDETFEVKEGETASVKITLKPAALTQGQLQCMVAAKTQEEIAACLPQENKSLSVHIGIDFSAYGDSQAVRVFSPAIRGQVASPTQGWNVGASYLIDVVTAASPDVVSTASRRFHDLRHAVGLNGGYKPGRFGAQAFASFSTEKDYISRTLGGAVSGDFFDKQFTPQATYAYTWDTIGRAGTDYDVFGKPFNTHEISLSGTTILSPLSVFVLGGSVSLESGDQSKPYRYVPLFLPGINPPAGADYATVNSLRYPAKPLEQLPLDRQRWSVTGRYISRIRANATLRLEERLYMDSWGVKGSTTDLRYMVDMNARVRVWPHFHFHIQNGASFYQRVYGVTPRTADVVTLPAFRTTDRELSPNFGVTGGGGGRIVLTDPTAKSQIALFSTLDVLYNQYFNALFITNRIAFYGTLGVEADFE
jgi:tetratricopeptide (TPR) repeat protein